ncbi:hypothetical protein N9E79_00830 [bacterium]|jgi:hypothetical protein|nr:hypothetical protein [bacterium]MDB4234988.1 hypothetical protein [bacterium]|tara:strand:- start:11844 stop:12020 length:177 start_codon:yes stop_codon:yes gene_type:complete
MKTTGRYSEHEELERAPEKPFLEDLSKDMVRIETHYNRKTSIEIKKKMIAFILGNINH